MNPETRVFNVHREMNEQTEMEAFFAEYFTGWWFGTLFIFPNSWDDDPI